MNHNVTGQRVLFSLFLPTTEVLFIYLFLNFTPTMSGMHFLFR